MEKKYIKPEVEVVDLCNQLLAGSPDATVLDRDAEYEALSKQGGWGWSDED